MRSLRITLLGTIVGMFVGGLSVIIALAGLRFSSSGAALPFAVAASAIPGSALSGLLGVALGCIVTKRERTILSVLIAVALAAAIILPGNYANHSLVPPLIFTMAVLNGLIVARAINPLCAKSERRGSRYLS